MGSSIIDIASQAHVSIATVSRIINGNYPVKEETRQRVLKVINDLNYIPNEVARSLKMDTTCTIGFLVSDISNNYFTTIAKVLEKTLSKINYSIIVCSTDEQKDRELSYLKMLLGKNVSGLIINTTGKNNDYLINISKTTPVVLIERNIFSNEFTGDFVGHNNQMSIKLLLDHLFQLNHRDIGVINGPLFYSTAKERQHAFVNEMKKEKITIPADRIRFCNNDFSVEGGYKAAEIMFTQPHPPSAVIVMNNSMTIGVLQYAKNKNINIPDDVSLVNHDSIQNSDIFYINPTHTSTHAELLGDTALDFIFSRIKNQNAKSTKLLLETELFIGNSTKFFWRFRLNGGRKEV